MGFLNRRSIIAGLLALICLPYVISWFGLVSEVIGCDGASVECTAYKRLFVLATIYVLFGLVAAWYALRRQRYWRAIVWTFLVMSIAVIAYDFYRSPGVDLWGVLRTKISVLQLLWEKRDLWNVLFWFGKDFLNPIFLVAVFAGTIRDSKSR